MPGSASELARRLAREAEAVCRHYLSKGRRLGNYWIVGDVENTPGRSLFVRLTARDGKRAGRWTDAATGQHGDLLDLIALNRNLTSLKEVLDEARHFLSLPKPEAMPDRCSAVTRYRGSPEAAHRLFAMSKPIPGTLAETYLRERGITALPSTASLRFHPRCYFWVAEDVPSETWPALIAAVSDPSGNITGVQRTWLDRSGKGKAPLETPRRAMGRILGNAVRFGLADDVLLAGEGVETILSLRCAMPRLPMAAALSANHLAALQLPDALRRLYIALDRDPAGYRALAVLSDRAKQVGIEPIALRPTLGDFNEDLRRLGLEMLRTILRPQIARADLARFLGPQMT
jgi:Toprim domain